jgi:cyclic beta-1,2-glucan synthetase
MWIVLLADSAVVAVDAAARALYRTLISRRHVLQWTTSARAVRAVSGGVVERWRHMWVSCALAAALAALVPIVNPEALPWAAPLLCLWFLAPLVAYATARPVDA